MTKRLSVLNLIQAVRIILDEVRCEVDEQSVAALKRADKELVQAITSIVESRK